ncbi:MAG: HPF/RaiA family ribosome-associated protein [Maioricimonas sp. JB049]
MHFSITSFHDTNGTGRRDWLRRRVMRELSRFAARIDRVDVTLSDMGSDRDGTSQHCRIRVRVHGQETVVATAKDDTPSAAVSRAAIRARRMLVDQLTRPRSQRERFRRRRRQISRVAAL